jgi:hypothetical protein
MFRFEETSLPDAVALAHIQAQTLADEVAKYHIGPPGYDAIA